MLNGDIIQNLLTLLNIQSYSNEEKEVADLLVNFLPTIGFETHQDAVGNVYGVRGTTNLYPMLNAHMDSVKATSFKSNTGYYNDKTKICEWCASCFTCKGCVAYYLTTEEKKSTCDKFKPHTYYTYIEDKKNPESEEASEVVAKILNGKIVGNGSRPIGGDDKCGIAIALQIAMDNPTKPLKLFFSVGEEIGCVGARHAVVNHRYFFEDVLYSVTIDRRGNRDLCLSSSGGKNGRHSFMRQLSDAYWWAGIVPNYVDGASADVVCIRNVVHDCVNISCGYESPHTCQETVVLEDFVRLYKMLNYFVKYFKITEKVHTIEYVPPKIISLPVTTVVDNEAKQLFLLDTKTNKAGVKYYSSKGLVSARNAFLKTLKTASSKGFKGIPIKYSLEENYESIADILEFMMPEVYNNNCIVKMKSKSDTNIYGYVGMDNGQIVLVIPIPYEVKSDSYLVDGHKLGNLFYNLYW